MEKDKKKNQQHLLKITNRLVKENKLHFCVHCFLNETISSKNKNCLDDLKGVGTNRLKLIILISCVVYTTCSNTLNRK